MDEVEEVRRRIDIIDLVSTYLTLKKAGANYRAVCPFHQEKTPSFMVSGEKQIFKCFGCGEGGDIFSFVMKMENLEFPEALRMLADRAGVVLKRWEFKPGEGKDRKSKLYQINDLSAKVFHKILLEHPSGKNALEYLKKRGISNQTIKDFLIGYAPSAKFLEGFLLKKGFTLSQIQEAGAPNRFFRRIMFPIKDAMGNFIAFTGRVIDPKQEPKYLNTADTVIFHKGRVLYNLHQAKGTIKQEKATIVVEGQMDVVASHQAGVKNVVASSGTALTDEHLKILYRYTPNLIFSFDSDTAGLATAKKAYEMAIKEGMNVKMIPLGNFKDPGEMIAESPKLWQETVKKAAPVIDWYFGLAFKGREELSSQEKKEIAREILPVIKIIPDQIEQAHYVNLLAKKLGINEEVIFDALSKTSANEKNKALPSQDKKFKISQEGLLLGILLANPGRLKELEESLKEEDFQDLKLRTIYRELKKEYSIVKDNNISLEKKLDREDRNLVSTLVLNVENLYHNQSEIDSDLKELLIHQKEHQRETLKDFYAAEIKKAESARDMEKLKKLIKEFQDAIK